MVIVEVTEKQKQLLLKANAAYRPGRLESRPLRVSQRSNALHFYHSAAYSADQYTSKSRSYYLYTDPRPSQALEPLTRKQYGQQSASTPSRHRVVSSLVTPFIGVQGKGKRTSASIKKQERSQVSRLSSSASVRSFASSALSRKRKYAAPPTLETLPSELLTEIFSYLDQKTLHNLVFCSKTMYEEASYNLYEKPRFTTTYRFAQFVTKITHDRHRACMVKEFDVSNLGKEAGEDEKPLAGWREWKFRSDPLHTIHRDDLGFSKCGKGGASKSLHPPPSPFLQRYSLIRDIPIGAVIHVLAACPFLRKIDLSNVPLAADYSVSKLGSHRTGYHPTAWTSLLFVSDVPKSFTWQEGDTRPLSCSVDLIDAFTKLGGLKCINLRGGVWVTRDVAERLVEGAGTVQAMDLRECGMYRERKWTVVGGREEVGRLIVEEKEAEKEKERKDKEAEARRRRMTAIF